MATALDFTISQRSRESTTPGGIPILRQRETRIAGRAFRATISVPGLTCRPIDAATTGAQLAQMVAERLTANFQRGLDADGDALPGISAATWRRRTDRAAQWSGSKGAVTTYAEMVGERKAFARRHRKRASIARLETFFGAVQSKWLLARFLRGFGWYDPVRGSAAATVGTLTARDPGGAQTIVGQVGREFRVRNQRGATLFPPLGISAQKPGLESGLFANSLTVRFMGGKTGQARVGIFFPAQREDYVTWAENHGAVLADVPASLNADIEEMLRGQAALLAGLDYRRVGRWALDAFEYFGEAAVWAFK